MEMFAIFTYRSLSTQGSINGRGNTSFLDASAQFGKHFVTRDQLCSSFIDRFGSSFGLFSPYSVNSFLGFSIKALKQVISKHRAGAGRQRKSGAQDFFKIRRHKLISE